jgi:hypothetical protein
MPQLVSYPPTRILSPNLSDLLSQDKIRLDKIRLLGFTTLHDSRRYAIPRCLDPSHYLILSVEVARFHPPACCSWKHPAGGGPAAPQRGRHGTNQHHHSRIVAVRATASRSAAADRPSAAADRPSAADRPCALLHGRRVHGVCQCRHHDASHLRRPAGV